MQFCLVMLGFSAGASDDAVYKLHLANCSCLSIAVEFMCFICIAASSIDAFAGWGVVLLKGRPRAKLKDLFEFKARARKA